MMLLGFSKQFPFAFLGKTFGGLWLYTEVTQLIETTPSVVPNSAIFSISCLNIHRNRLFTLATAVVKLSETKSTISVRGVKLQTYGVWLNHCVMAKVVSIQVCKVCVRK